MEKAANPALGDLFDHGSILCYQGNVVRAVKLFLISTLCFAADPLEFRSGPFTVFSTEGDEKGRDALNFLEQLRHALGAQLGEKDLQSVWPIKVVITNTAKGTSAAPLLQFGRDAWLCSVPAMQSETVASATKILLDSWPGIMPPPIERGLIELYSTLQVEGTRVTLGAVPGRKTRDWSRAHMFAVHPDYSGKLRVLLFNLGKGVDRDVAYRNAFSKSPEEIEAALDRYIEAGNYGTYPVSGRPLNPRRELVARKPEGKTLALVLADVQLANGKPNAQASYTALGDSPEAQEGLGLLAAKAGQLERARSLLANANGAKALLESANLLPDPVRRRAALVKAVAANPKWAEPHRQLAILETDDAHKAAELKAAAQLEPRNASTWVALAEIQEKHKVFADSAKSWAAAERATDDIAGRELIRQARAGMERKRVEADIAAREEARRKTEQELQDLRNKALTEIRVAEAKANAGKPVIDASSLPEYKEEQPATAEGSLQRIDCLGERARLHVLSGKRVLQLLVANPSTVTISGGGEKSLGCGVQRPARSVAVGYTPRKDARQGTAGDVVTIEFR